MSYPEKLPRKRARYYWLMLDARGWETLRNGDLLTAAEEGGFDVLLTTDKNMPYQQNLAGRNIAVVILGREQWPQLRPHFQRGVEAVNTAAPGSYVEIDNPAI